jgi:LacI family transcriptional regulator
MKKVRLADIAKEAQVGTATVERVLNARGNVSSVKIEKVIQAARRLGYRQPFRESYHGVLRIEVIMVRRDTTFYHRLANAFQRISESLDPCISVHRTFADEADPRSVARCIANPGFGEHPAETILWAGARTIAARLSGHQARNLDRLCPDRHCC